MTLVVPVVAPAAPWIPAATLAKCHAVSGQCVDCDPLAPPVAPPTAVWTDQELVDAASEFLYVRSGCRFPGDQLTRTVEVRVDACAGHPAGCCTRCTVHRLDLGCDYPVLEIIEVRDPAGVVVPSSLWRVEEWSHLVRLRDPDGSCPRWADGSTVRYRYGRPVPKLGAPAAFALACGMRAWTTPVQELFGANITSVSAGGVSLSGTSMAELVKEGLTGISEVDRFLSTYPAPKSRVAVWTPGMESERHVLVTGP